MIAAKTSWFPEKKPLPKSGGVSENVPQSFLRSFTHAHTLGLGLPDGMDLKRARLDGGGGGEKDVEGVTLTLDNAKDVQSSYVRTRHNNLRCFPKCSPAHKTKSFCGMPLYLSCSAPAAEATLVAEFRNAATPSSLRVGSTCDAQTLLDNKYFEGVQEHEGQGRWVVNPPRKWRYEGKTSAVDYHLLTMYLVSDGVVVGMVNTPKFRVVPIWRIVDEPKVVAVAAAPTATPLVALVPMDKDRQVNEEEARAVLACLAHKTAFSLSPPAQARFPMLSMFPPPSYAFPPPNSLLLAPSPLGISNLTSALYQRFPQLQPHLLAAPNHLVVTPRN